MKELKDKLVNAERIALLGVGSDLRGDDAAGMLVAQQLKDASNFKVFLGSTAPENLSGEIKKFNPTHLIIVDIVETGDKPGAIVLIGPQDAGGISFSTHRLPLKMMVEYLLKFLKCKVIIIGIQPKTLEFGSQPSQEVIKAAKEVAALICKITAQP